jgi:hypothetical protein
MIRVLIGLLWIFFGLLFLWRPGVFRAWLRWRSLRKIRWTLFWFTLGCAISLLLATWPLSGFLPKLLLLVGIVGIVKAYFFLKCEASEWLIERFADLPEEAYRWYALAWIAIGLILVFVL